MNLYATGTVPMGFDTVVFTATQVSNVIQAIIAQIVGEWPELFMEIEVNGTIRRQMQATSVNTAITDLLTGEHLVMTFAKNKEMADFFHKNSYELMPTGEGPISYHIRKRHKIMFELPVLKEIQYVGNTDMLVDPYYAWICSEALIELTAVTPCDPKTNPFSEWAVRVLFKSCFE